MPQINTADFKKGVKIIIEGDPYDILECNFVKPGKGQALYKTRLRNLLKGTILDRTYKSGDSMEEADIRRGRGSYSYRDGNSYYFLDNETFEQYALPAESIDRYMQFLMEGTEVELMFWNNQLISMVPPQHVVLEVTYTEPAARGNTATNVTKGATVETGVEVQVPAFIEAGNKVKVDVESGSYVERVNI
ncbi:elongation factor P [Rubinisphaera sp.]|uniref:elongation factor P n=1 Tax=Rubinisphaera sp. TaxID=2024857 RepID=UPI000C0F65D5|nr:elongation factor P [Rubinisphaera sp.]MBV08926.1 elongation factor P [Rubinisphaera sp.]